MPQQKEILLSQLFGSPMAHQQKASRPISSHIRRAAIITLTCIGLAGLLTIAMPRRYESHVKFLVNNERADLVISPEKNPTYTPRGEVTEAQVNSEIELLKSRDIHEAVARDAKLYLNFQNPQSPEPTALSLAKAVSKLERDLRITAIHRTNIIQVDYGTRNPDLSVTVLTDLGNRYLNAHLAAHSAPGTFDFFRAQVEKYAAELAAIRTDLSDFRMRKQLFAMPQQQAATVEQLQTVEAQLKTLDAEMSEQKTRQGELQSQLAVLPDRVVTQVKSAPNASVVAHLQTVLTDLHDKRIELAMKFKPQDRMLVEVDQKIAQAERELAEVQKGGATEETSDRDSLHEALQADQVKGKIALRALESRRIALAGIRQNYVQQLGRMDQSSVELQKLEQKEKEALDNYTLYAHHLDEVRLADSLDKQKFSNVTMIEKPVSLPIPVSPKPILNLALGAFLGLLISAGMVFFSEFRGTAHQTAVTTGAEFLGESPLLEILHAPGSGD